MTQTHHTKPVYSLARAMAVAAATSALVLGSLTAPAFASGELVDPAIPAVDTAAPADGAAVEALVEAPAKAPVEEPAEPAAAEEPAAAPTEPAAPTESTQPTEQSESLEEALAPLSLLASVEPLVAEPSCPSFPGMSFDDLNGWDVGVRSPSGEFLTVWQPGDSFEIWDAYSVELSDGSDLQSDPFDGWGNGVSVGSDYVSVDYDCGRRSVVAGTTTDHIAGSTAGFSVVAEKKYYGTADLVRRAFTVTNTGAEAAAASTLVIESNLGSDSSSTEVASATWGRVTNDGEWRSDPVVSYLWGGAGTTIASGPPFAASTLAATPELADQASSGLLSSFRNIPSAYLAGISTPIVNWGASALGVSSTSDRDNYTVTYGLPMLAPGESATIVEFAHLQMYAPDTSDWVWLDEDVAAAEVGVAYSDVISGPVAAAGGTYTITWGALPAGLTLDSATGVISGVPTINGLFPLQVRVDTADRTDYGWIDLVVMPEGIDPLAWTDSTLSAMRIGTEYSDGVQANHADTQYWLEGILPRGLSFDGTTGLISGVPEVTEGYFFWIGAESSDGSIEKFFAGAVQDASGTASFTTAAIGTPIGEVGIEFDVTGLKDGSDYTVQMFSTPVTLASGTISGSAFNRVIMLPANAPTGAHRLLFTGTGFDGQTLLVEAWFAVDAAGNLAAISYTGPVTLPAPVEPGQTPGVAPGAVAPAGTATANAAAVRAAALPTTGGDAKPLMHGALLLLLVGAGLLALRQRGLRRLTD